MGNISYSEYFQTINTMKTTINIIIIILLISSTYAQKAFNYYDIKNKDIGWSITESNSGKLFVAGKLDQESGQQKEGIILRLNSDGEIEEYRNYFLDYNIIIIANIVNDPTTGSIYATGETINNELIIIEIDEDLDIISLIKTPCQKIEILIMRNY